MLTQNLEFKIAKIHRLPEGSRLKAFVDVSVNDALLIKGLRVVDGKAGLFVSMPQEQGRDKRWYDLVRCLNEDIQGMISEKVISAYQTPEQN
jgi:stage V sporulation protein G